jgi:uncharacterized protein (TIGR02757 family)
MKPSEAISNTTLIPGQEGSKNREFQSGIKRVFPEWSRSSERGMEATMVVVKMGVVKKVIAKTERSSSKREKRSKLSANQPTIRVSEEMLRQALDDVRLRCDIAARRAADPVRFAHRYTKREDQEIVALIAASLAFGNVKALCAKIDDALRRLGPNVAEVAEDPARVFASLQGFRHRLYGGRDLAQLVIGARSMQRAHGFLGASLQKDLATGRPFREAIAVWVRELRQRGGFADFGKKESVGADHLLPDPTKGSAVKRLMLFLRWMSRPADGVDLGLWDISPAKLVIPLDTHIHKLSRNIGLTLRKAADYRAAEEITTALSRLDPHDPTKYDFSLCHLGMVQSCPSRKDEERCIGCGVKPICRHWQISKKRESGK